MIRALALFIALLPKAGHADTTFSGDLMVTGQAGIGTTAPRARAHVQMKAADDYAVLVSSPDGTKLFALDKEGKLGIGVTDPAALMDIKGQADSSDIGLQLRVGNSSQTSSSIQMTFAAPGDSPMRHNLRTRADATQDEYNRIEFYVWDATDSVNELGDLHVLSLQKNSSAANGSVHVMPFGNPTAELVVSSGTGLGGGSILRFRAETHSSRSIKSDIAYLPLEKEHSAYEDVRNQRPVRFKYSEDGPEFTGLIFEEAPQSVRGVGDSVVFDERLLNMEIALKEVGRRIAAVNAQIAALEGK